MKLLLRWLPVCVLFFSVTNASAQKYWTLNECIDYALENNITIQQGEVNTEISKQNYKQSRWAGLPNLNASANNNYNFGRNIDPFTNQFVNQRVRSNVFSINSSVTLFNGLQIRNQSKQSQFDFLATEQDLEVTKNNIALSIANFYLQILFNGELVSTNRNQVKRTQQQLDRTQKLFEAGRLTKGNVLEIKAQLANEQLNLVNADNQLRSSIINLAQLLNLNPDSFNVQSPSSLNIPEGNHERPDVIYEAIKNSWPEIQSAQYRYQSAEMGYRVAKGGRSPRLVLSGNMNTLFTETRKDFGGFQTDTVPTVLFLSDNTPVFQSLTFPTTTSVTPFSDQLSDNFGRSIGISLSIPIFNGFQTTTNIERARLGMRLSKLTLIDTQNRLFQDIATAHNDFKAAKARYDANQSSLEAQQENFGYIEKRFQLGAINAQDYTDAKNTLFLTESNVLQAKYELIFRSKILDFYQGKPLIIQ